MEELKVYRASDGKIFFEDDPKAAYKKCQEYESTLTTLECNGLTMFDGFGHVTTDFKHAAYLLMEYAAMYSKNLVAMKVIEKFQQVYARAPKEINAYTYGLWKFDEKEQDYYPVGTETLNVYRNIIKYLDK